MSHIEKFFENGVTQKISREFPKKGDRFVVFII